MNDKESTLELFTSKINNQEPFTFTKFGDMELLCMENPDGHGADHYHSHELADRLKRAWQALSRDPWVYLGKWTHDIQNIRHKIESECGVAQNYVFFDVLLMHENQWLTENLYNFYKAINRSRRRKIYIGNEKLCRGVKEFLRIDRCIEIKSKNAFDDFNKVLEEILRECRGELVMILTSAGPLGKLLAHECLFINPRCQFIDLGSAMDPLFIGNTRAKDPSNSDKVKEFFNII